MSAERQIILDTETTGLEPEQGHRIIEIGCIEVVNRRITGRTFHRYVNPERDVDDGALAVHGISRADLEREPRFAEIADELVAFIADAELVIHNAAFDVAFLDVEFAETARRAGSEPRTVASFCRVLDTLALAREMHPGQRNSLDALCKRYSIDNSRRELHGALLDAQLLAEAYLAMTGGQATLALGLDDTRHRGESLAVRALVRPAVPLVRITVSPEEREAHEAMLAIIAKASGGTCVWRRIEADPAPSLEAEALTSSA
jgi:DNA polymerase-3 subunit epsilon